MDPVALTETQPALSAHPQRVMRWLPLALLIALIGGLHYALWALLSGSFALNDPFVIGLGVYLPSSTPNGVSY